jgi:putative endonuclease
MTKKQSYKFGILAEKISAIFLIFKGYKILHKRYKTYFGEIDIIAKKSNNIVFIEVKARKNKVNIEEILSNRQANRIKSAGQFFISKNPQFSACNLRFDFIEINGSFLPKHHLNFLS